MVKLRQIVGWGALRALTKVSCRGEVSVNTFPDFGDGVIGRNNVSKPPDGEEPVRFRRYPAHVRSRVKIEITTAH